MQPGDNDSEESESDAFLTSAMEEAESSKAEEGVPFSSEKFESALTDAFNRTDEEFGKADNAALVGTTAVVALVGSRQLYVANCGKNLPASSVIVTAHPLAPTHGIARTRGCMSSYIFRVNAQPLPLLCAQFCALCQCPGVAVQMCC
jgi:hypothetical protein